MKLKDCKTYEDFNKYVGKSFKRAQRVTLLKYKKIKEREDCNNSELYRLPPCGFCLVIANIYKNRDYNCVNCPVEFGCRNSYKLSTDKVIEDIHSLKFENNKLIREGRYWESL